MIEVLFFGKMADVAGRRSFTTRMTEAGTLCALRDEIFAEAVAAGTITAHDIRMSVNKAVVTDDRPLRDGDEVAFFSVFSGG